MSTARYTFRSAYRSLPADPYTAIGLYRQLRDRWAGSVLLESALAGGTGRKRSFIALCPQASIAIGQGRKELRFPGVAPQVEALPAGADPVQAVEEFLAALRLPTDAPVPGMDAVFGITGYDAVSGMAPVRVGEHAVVPAVHYVLYRYVVVLDHHTDRLHLCEWIPPGAESTLDELERAVRRPEMPDHAFALVGEESSDLSDQRYRELVQQGIAHCQRGDVFQIVLSKAYAQGFLGDDLQVYRALRSINPSPYMFYLDAVHYRIFGSSPETQVSVRHGRATVNPIAGTARRTGNPADDAPLGAALLADPKENAEHVMLVDLGRNDLGRSAEDIRVERFREVVAYSHVLHLVSEVSGALPSGVSAYRVLADTFPAGTLSGAPKVRAMQLIDGLEGSPRGPYAGCIGWLGVHGDGEHAILIRSFLSTGNVLHYRAGAGIVVASTPEGELQETHNKLAALRSALAEAATPL